jgi:hypothetical protein
VKHCEERLLGRFWTTHLVNQNGINDTGRVFEEMMGTGTYPNEGCQYA